jgi:hypothetical protein
LRISALIFSLLPSGNLKQISSLILFKTSLFSSFSFFWLFLLPSRSTLFGFEEDQKMTQSPINCQSCSLSIHKSEIFLAIVTHGDLIF